MNETKYYIGVIYITVGDYGFQEIVRFELTGRKQPATHMEKIASCWYGGKGRKDGDSYLFNGSTARVTADEVVQVSEATYNEMRGILPDMTNL